MPIYVEHWQTYIEIQYDDLVVRICRETIFMWMRMWHNYFFFTGRGALGTRPSFLLIIVQHHQDPMRPNGFQARQHDTEFIAQVPVDKMPLPRRFVNWDFPN